MNDAAHTSTAYPKPASVVNGWLKVVFSFPAMLGLSFVACLLYQLRGFRVDPDLWWHIRVGQDILRNHSWPTVDPYSFTVYGTPWLAYEWLGDVIIGFVAKFGLQALEALLMLLAASVAIGLYCYATLCAQNSKAGIASAVLVTIFAAANFTLRPQMLGAIFLILTLIALEQFRRGRSKALFFLPVIFLLWVNIHGSWIVGLGVIAIALIGGLYEFRIGAVEGVRWTERQRLQLELALLGALLMIPLTPYGTRLATYPFLVASSVPVGTSSVMEWRSMPFNTLGGKVFLALLVGASVLQVIYQSRFRLQQWLLAIGGTVMACLHVRFVLVFAPFFVPVLATMLSELVDKYRPEKDKFALNAVLMAAGVAGIVWCFPSRLELRHDVEEKFPERAVTFLREHPDLDPILNNYVFGGYLLANLPQHRVFIDGREDLYELAGVMSDYLQATQLKPAALSILRFYRIKTCLLVRGEALAIVLSGSADWKQIYADQETVIFERADSVNFAEVSRAREMVSSRRVHEPRAD